jgi:hypothetical protein
MIGGFVAFLRQKGTLNHKTFTNINVFSVSNYQQGGGQSNYDCRMSRIQYATGVRLIEDMQCLNELLGTHNYRYRLLFEQEALVRGYRLASDTFEFPKGDISSFRQQEWEIHERLVSVINDYLFEKDTAVIFPLAIRSHVDHIIVRAAAAAAFLKKCDGHKATIYFIEDKPYAGLADQIEWDEVHTFLSQFSYSEHYFPFDFNYVNDLLYKHYPSQVEKTYSEGLFTRCNQLKIAHNSTYYLDRLIKLNHNKP